MPERRPKKLLFICGSLNQTTQMHQIARELPEYRHAFTPFYGNREFDFARAVGGLEGTIGGHKLGRRCLEYLRDHRLPCEPGGALGDFDLAFNCSDLTWQKNLAGKPVVLVQEGMTDPPNAMQRLVRWSGGRIPGWLAGTSALGLSHRYTRFCVASEGYRQHFLEQGCDPDKLVVTGIPNFDHCRRYLTNDFPYRGYVLLCTSDIREVYGFENRRRTLERAVELARTRGKPLLVKLHPNERVERAVREVERHAPGARVFTGGRAEEMVANADTVICQYSSLAYVALALDKEVFSYFDLALLRRLCPLQNGGTSARRIADVARELLGDARPAHPHPKPNGRAAEVG